MTITKKLIELNLDTDTKVKLSYSEGVDVFHYNETEIETALSQTSVVNEFASLIANTKLDARNHWNGNIIQHLREQDYLEDYERGSYGFEDYIAEAISDNFYDVELIDYSTEKYDHKRGFTTLTAEVEVPVSNFIEVDPFVSGWTVSVQTEDGVLTLNT
jgi:hypothetical protein